ncbi:hypothetical protein J4P02_22350 [Pseudomonas sp. NFXW11]|uniref:hypothetical protein n=1 Tax=Pseudomonas sp. NFXW11 TaxID=2819531 RepID=UPI003CF70B0C
MSYGLRMWGADGTLQFDTSTSTYRIIINEVVDSSGWPANYTKVYKVPGCSPDNSVAMVIPLTNIPQDFDVPQNRQLESSMGVGEAYVRNFISGETVGSRSTAIMRFIVMRYK